MTAEPIYPIAKLLDKGRRLIFDGKGIQGINGARIYTQAPMIFDHFTYGAGAFNSHVPQYFVTTETGAATPFAPGAAALGGLATAVTGATTNNGEELAGKNVGWKPSTAATKKPLVMEIRAKFVGATTATDGDFYFGFAEAVTFTNSLPYVLSAASAFTTSVPSDFVGFGYTSIATSGNAFLTGGNPVIGISSKAGTDTAKVLSPALVKDSAFHIYRVEVDVNGAANFFIDGTFRGNLNAATTATVAHTPYINVVAKNSHAQTATIDYVFVGSDLE